MLPLDQTSQELARARKPLPRFVAAPFVCMLIAVAAGIAIDRFADPWGTRKWVGLALLLIALACFLARRRSLGTALILASLVPIGGAWHHYRYSDIEPDDLALEFTEAGRPAWVRGVVREALGVRQRFAGHSASAATPYRESRPASCST